VSQEEADQLYKTTGSYRPHRHWKAKITEEDVIEILQLAQSGETKNQIAAAYGINIKSIDAILTGQTWSHVSLDGKPRSNMELASQEQFRTADCIKYDGQINARGFGRHTKLVDGKQIVTFAHWLAWEKEYGPVPSGSLVVHYCNYKACINVQHLRIITKAQAGKLRMMASKISQKHASGERHGNSKLTKKQVDEIKQLLSMGERKSEIAKAYRVTQSSIAAIETGKVWRDKTGTKTDDILPVEEFVRLRQQYLDKISQGGNIALSARELTSARLNPAQIYTRRELIYLFGLENTYLAQNVTIVRPDTSRFRSIWLFLTGSNLSEIDSTPVLSDDRAFFPKHHMDHYVRNHRSAGMELMLFHRNWKTEYGKTGGFRYIGNFEFVRMSDTGEHLILHRAIDPILEQAQKDLDAFVLEHELEDSHYAEGTRYRVLGSRYERDAIARAAAIRYHGTRCQACDFSFSEVYGAHGENYIQVHHHKPLASYGERVKIDPIADMAVLCSNCHSMIHRNPHEPLTVEELKKLIFLQGVPSVNDERVT